VPDMDKSEIINDNKNKAGVYQWIHKESGNTYVGSAADLSKRLKYYYNKEYLFVIRIVISIMLYFIMGIQHLVLLLLNTSM
jgi:excinuclease UvrABC nuclease subunit